MVNQRHQALEKPAAHIYLFLALHPDDLSGCLGFVEDPCLEFVVVTGSALLGLHKCRGGAREILV